MTRNEFPYAASYFARSDPGVFVYEPSKESPRGILSVLEEAPGTLAFGKGWACQAQFIRP